MSVLKPKVIAVAYGYKILRSVVPEVEVYSRNKRKKTATVKGLFLQKLTALLIL